MRYIIDPETLETAKNNYDVALAAVRRAIDENATKEVLQEAIEIAHKAGGDYRSFIKCNYNL